MKKFSSIKTTKSRQTGEAKLWWRLLLSFLLLFLCLWFFANFFGNVASAVIYPVVKIESWFKESSSALPSYLRDRNSLIAAQEELEQKLIESQLDNRTQEALEFENSRLRSLLGEEGEARIVAGVVARPTDLPYDILLLDRGESDGVNSGAPVYAAKNQIIGFVSRVYEHSALVTLVTTPGVASTVYVYGPNIYTTAVGVGSGTLKISVPQGINIESGNTVILPSLGVGVYGNISVVDSEPSHPEQYGFVSIDIPLQSLRMVSVGERAIPEISFDEAKKIVEEVKSSFLEVPVPDGVLVDAHSTTTATSTEEDGD